MKKSINRKILLELYAKQKKSVSEISRKYGCSENKINYWLKKYKIRKRTISEAVYVKYNPKGDPFKFRQPKNVSEALLFGLGVGLYWGEGNKANKNTIRLGSSDANLLRSFVKFLIKFFAIKKSDLRFHLHIFTDINIEEAKRYWIKELRIKEKQIYKPLISKSGSVGTYRTKSKYGVMTLYYGNTKARNKIVHLIEDIKPL